MIVPGFNISGAMSLGDMETALNFLHNRETFEPTLSDVKKQKYSIDAVQVARKESAKPSKSIDEITESFQIPFPILRNPSRGIESEKRKAELEKQKAEAAEAERKRIEAERQRAELEQQRAEQQRAEQQRAEQQRAEQQRAEQIRLEEEAKQRILLEQQAKEAELRRIKEEQELELRKLEIERQKLELERQKIEAERQRLAQESQNLELKARIEQEKRERERERLEQERLAQEKQRLEQERLERERLERERIEQERRIEEQKQKLAAQARIEQERRLRIEQERAKREQLRIEQQRKMAESMARAQPSQNQGQAAIPSLATPVKAVDRQPKISYESMDIDSLYKEVEKYMLELGVSKAPVDKKLLEERFGKQNISRLIIKSYIISIGKRVTIGYGKR